MENDTISRQAAIDAVNSLIDRFEQILSDIRESRVDDSVCGMCEYDGAFVGQSGGWCNECPGFEKDNCFKLSDECRERWFDSVELPSAQQGLDEWCTDCAEYDKDRHCCPRYNRVIRTALDDATPWKWTPVEDALPIKSGSYLACNARGAVYTVFYFGNRWGTDGVIAWAELPEPYRKEGKHD